MPTPNSQNPGKGQMFQKKSAEVLSKYFGIDFLIDFPIPIGKPPKNHKFDLVSEDQKIIGECKNYSWTETGNIPSAKMGFVNEAVFYLSFLSDSKNRFIAMRRDEHPKRRETLAEYYYRTNKHLLGKVIVIEIDEVSGLIREINGT